MREIKFRYFGNKSGMKYFTFKDINNPEAHGEEFGYLQLGDGRIACIDCPDESHNNIMQYTGLKDKNGKEIYEGDILKNNKRNWEVYWDEDGYWGMRIVVSRDITTGRSQIDKIYSEVIGNIYENPELSTK